MMVKKRKINNGFSLVELMVVVGVIGILTTIGIPSYQAMVARTYQAEAKAHLNSIYQAENSFYTEYSIYTTNLRALGVAATGQKLRYNAGFSSVGCSGAIIGTSGAPGWGSDSDNDIVSTSGTGASWMYTINDISNLGQCTSKTFSAGAWGNPTNTINATNSNDWFSMTNNRILTHKPNIGLPAKPPGLEPEL